MLPLVSAQLADSPWLTFQGNSKHTGLSQYDTSHVDGTIKWKINLREELKLVPFIESVPVIGKDNTIYVATHENNLFAINPDGTTRWKFDAGKTVDIAEYSTKKAVVSTPAIADDGTIYFITLENWLIAVNPDGTEKWRFEHPTSHLNGWTSPTIGEDGTIYISSAGKWFSDSKKESAVYALNPDGTEKWRYSNELGGSATPAIDDDGTIYVVGVNSKDAEEHPDEGKLISLSKEGKLNWEFFVEEWVEGHPTIDSDGTVYIGSKEGELWAINKDGTIKWKFVAERVNFSDAIYYITPDYEHLSGISAASSIGKDGTIYVPAWNGIFYALDPDGKVKWEFRTRQGYEALSSGVIISDEGTIYLTSLNTGWLYTINPQGELLWDFTTNVATFGLTAHSPSIAADGTVYVTANDGHLYALTGDGNYQYKSRKVVRDGVTTYLPAEERGPESRKEPERYYLEGSENETKIRDVDYSAHYGEEERFENAEECVIDGYFIGEEECRAIMDDKYGEQGFFSKLIDWFRNLFR